MKCNWCPPTCEPKFPECFTRYPGQKQRPNPGNIQDLHVLAHQVMPKFFDGLELNYRHRLAPNKYITSNWVLSVTRPSGFRFGGIYTLRMHDDMLQTPTIQADINPTTLSSNFGIVYYPFNCLRLQTRLQRADAEAPLRTETTIELMRPHGTVTANLYDVSKEAGRATISFMRSVTTYWALGAELLLEWTQPRTVMADTAFAARYTRYNYSIATTASRQGLNVSYWHRLNSRIQMANLLAWNRKTEKTIATVCYQWDFNEAIVRGMFDSDLCVGFMYNRTLNHIPCGVSVSLLLNIPANRFIFGLKFNLDPSGLRRGEF